LLVEWYLFAIDWGLYTNVHELECALFLLYKGFSLNPILSTIYAAWKYHVNTISLFLIRDSFSDL
jgi:hypothetical protein